MLDIGHSYTDSIDRQWRQLAEPGAWLTGTERVAVAAAMRAARNGGADSGELDPPMAEAAAVFGGDPAAPRRAWVDDLAVRGVSAGAYTEILSICSRVAAIDTFLYGAGHPERPLPEPVSGEPHRRTADGVSINGGFTPTAGPAFPTTVVSMLPGEQDVLFDLHGALYLALDEMPELEIVKDLDRRQMELIAARTSLLNECFF